MNEPKKFYFYDVDGKAQEYPDSDTVIVSEIQLPIKDESEMLIEDIFDLSDAQPADYDRNPLPVCFDAHLEKTIGASLFDILEYKGRVGVAQYHGGRFWFDILFCDLFDERESGAWILIAIILTLALIGGAFLLF